MKPIEKIEKCVDWFKYCGKPVRIKVVCEHAPFTNEENKNFTKVFDVFTKAISDGFRDGFMRALGKREFENMKDN